MTIQPLDDVKVASSAKKRICIDFDETLVHWGDLDALPEWKDGAPEAVRWLINKGLEVVILTSRASRRWWRDHCLNTDQDPEAFGSEQVSLVYRSLASQGFNNLEVTAEKYPALYYIDDRAIAFTSWDLIMFHLAGGEPWR